jgi:hypothetical protein
MREGMMNINEQLEKFLADLGVEMEQPGHEYDDGNAIPEVSIFQSSRDHYGVFYRLDIIDHVPQLRIMVPIDTGSPKMEMYLVRMSECLPLNSLFSAIANYQGSSAFERSRDASLQHLLYAVAEVMKQLFWSGDLNTMSFPPEIDVCRIL